MHFVSMVSIPLRQLKQVTFRGNITIYFDEVVSVVSLHVSMQKKIQNMSAYQSDKQQYFLQEGTGCKKIMRNTWHFSNTSSSKTVVWLFRTCIFLLNKMLDWWKQSLFKKVCFSDNATFCGHMCIPLEEVDVAFLKKCCSQEVDFISKMLY